ncbi:MAG: MTAP family purine nucleoside phosphorylase [Syntrophomonadaceae bacterium]|jgi:5'-methylthioadenosine phosphorylase|nr:MTAP family purine nucleoside phosphorylase [Syntrophomonadaceae bacterium]
MVIPGAEYAVIGGSGTFKICFPEELHLNGVEVSGEDLVFDTPYGKSPPFKLLQVAGEDGGSFQVLTCKMHGWRQGVARGVASQQVFWVLREAGVKRIIAEGGVGAINHLLKPRDVVIPDDYMDFSMRKDTGLEDRYLLVMRDALCPEIRECLVQIAEKDPVYRVFDRGTYVVTDGRHFESPAEVNLFRIGGGDVVGQSLCPEVYLAREIGACYAGVYLVVNHAEGVAEPWRHQELEEIFYTEGYALGKLIIQTLRALSRVRNCSCHDLRKETLLKGIY